MSDKWEKKHSKKKHRAAKAPKTDNETPEVPRGSGRYADDISNFLYNHKHKDEEEEELAPPPGWDKVERKAIERASTHQAAYAAKKPTPTPTYTHDKRDRVVKALPMSDAHRQTPSKRPNPMPLEPPSSHHPEPLNK